MATRKRIRTAIRKGVYEAIRITLRWCVAILLTSLCPVAFIFTFFPSSCYNRSHKKDADCSPVAKFFMCVVIMPAVGYVLGLVFLWWRKMKAIYQEVRYKITKKASKPELYVGFIQRNKYVEPELYNGSLCPALQLVTGTWNYKERLDRDYICPTHSNICVRHVLKVRNERLLKQYNERKHETRQTSESTVEDELLGDPIITTNLADILQQEQDMPATETRWNLDAGEVYLFHGTKLECVTGIIGQGFDLNRSIHGLYGKAIYLAESSKKADQYTVKASSKKRRQTDLAMLVVRVYLGKIKCHEDGTEFTMRYKGDQPEYDTVVAGFNEEFREFMVFDQKKVYPEYVIIYDRTN